MAKFNNIPTVARGKAVTVPELAEILNIGATQIGDLITQGMPLFERGSRGIACFVD